MQRRLDRLARPRSPPGSSPPGRADRCRGRTRRPPRGGAPRSSTRSTRNRSRPSLHRAWEPDGVRRATRRARDRRGTRARSVGATLSKVFRRVVERLPEDLVSEQLGHVDDRVAAAHDERDVRRLGAPWVRKFTQMCPSRWLIPMSSKRHTLGRRHAGAPRPDPGPRDAVDVAEAREAGCLKRVGHEWVQRPPARVPTWAPFPKRSCRWTWAVGWRAP